MARKTVETSDFDAFARRIVRAYTRRVGDGDLDGLESLAGMERQLDQAMREAVASLHAPPWNYSWAEIARVLGVSRQAAHQRFSGDGEADGGKADLDRVVGADVLNGPVGVDGDV